MYMRMYRYPPVMNASRHKNQNELGQALASAPKMIPAKISIELAKMIGMTPPWLTRRGK